MYSQVNQLHVDMYLPPFSDSFFRLGRYQVLGRVLCAIQYSEIRYLLYIQSCIFANHTVLFGSCTGHTGTLLCSLCIVGRP